MGVIAIQINTAEEAGSSHMVRDEKNHLREAK